MDVRTFAKNKDNALRRNISRELLLLKVASTPEQNFNMRDMAKLHSLVIRKTVQLPNNLRRLLKIFIVQFRVYRASKPG